MAEKEAMRPSCRSYMPASANHKCHQGVALDMRQAVARQPNPSQALGTLLHHNLHCQQRIHALSISHEECKAKKRIAIHLLSWHSAHSCLPDFL